jgi:hypothetical protein
MTFDTGIIPQSGVRRGIADIADGAADQLLHGKASLTHISGEL